MERLKNNEINSLNNYIKDLENRYESLKNKNKITEEINSNLSLENNTQFCNKNKKEKNEVKNQ